MKVCKEYQCEEEAAPARSRCWHHYYIHRNGGALSAAPEGFKMLMIDIETTPTLAWTWDIWNVNIGINQIVRPGGMMCFASKWYGQKEVDFYSEWEQGKDRMVLEAWRLLDESDVVCHFYGSRFDVPHLNTEFLKQGFPPPSPFKQIDLKLAVSKRFKLVSNKLQFVSQVLELEGKEEHEGFPLWTKCMDRDPDALERMESYNRRDVTLLEEVYEVLLPWIPGHPNRNLYTEGAGCPRCGCGADQLVESGYAYTNLSMFKQYRCLRCSTFFRSCKREVGVALQESTL